MVPTAPVVMEQPVPEGVLPLDVKTLGDFLEAMSRNTVKLEAEQNPLPYAVLSSKAAYSAIMEVGRDPERTLRYWLSPQFEADMAARGPTATSDRRTVDSMLTILLGDRASEEEFAAILEHLPPTLSQDLTARRAMRQ